MPVYEYRCLTCGKEFEYQQRMADPAKTVCEACGGELERLISRTAFQLKGGGWYKDLYASTKPESKPGEGGDGGAKVDAKPAATDGKPATTESKPAAPSTESKPAATESKPAAPSGGTGTGTGSGTGSGSA